MEVCKLHVNLISSDEKWVTLKIRTEFPDFKKLSAEEKARSKDLHSTGEIALDEHRIATLKVTNKQKVDLDIDFQLVKCNEQQAEIQFETNLYCRNFTIDKGNTITFKVVEILQ